MPAGGKHSGGGRFDVQRHVVNTRRRRLGEAGGRWGVGCRKPGLNTQPPGRCAPPETAWTWTSAKPLQAPNRRDTLMRSTPGGRRARRGHRSSFFQLCFTARSADAAALTACCQTEPPPLLQTHCQILTAFALWGCKYDKLWRWRRRWG